MADVSQPLFTPLRTPQFTRRSLCCGASSCSSASTGTSTGVADPLDGHYDPTIDGGEWCPCRAPLPTPPRTTPFTRRRSGSALAQAPPLDVSVYIPWRRVPRMPVPEPLSTPPTPPFTLVECRLRSLIKLFRPNILCVSDSAPCHQPVAPMKRLPWPHLNSRLQLTPERCNTPASGVNTPWIAVKTSEVPPTRTLVFCSPQAAHVEVVRELICVQEEELPQAPVEMPPGTSLHSQPGRQRAGGCYRGPQLAYIGKSRIMVELWISIVV